MKIVLKNLCSNCNQNKLVSQTVWWVDTKNLFIKVGYWTSLRNYQSKVVN